MLVDIDLREEESNLGCRNVICFGNNVTFNTIYVLYGPLHFSLANNRGLSVNLFQQSEIRVSNVCIKSDSCGVILTLAPVLMVIGNLVGHDEI